MGSGAGGMGHDSKTSGQWPVVSGQCERFGFSLVTDYWPLTTGAPVTFVIAGGAYGLLEVGVAPRIEGAVLCPKLTQCLRAQNVLTEPSWRSALSARKNSCRRG